MLAKKKLFLGRRACSCIRYHYQGGTAGVAPGSAAYATLQFFNSLSQRMQLGGWSSILLILTPMLNVIMYIYLHIMYIYYIYIYIIYRLAKNGGKRDKKVSDDVRDRIRATSSIGGVRIVSLGCGEVLGTHEPTMFNHNGPLYDFF